VSAADAGIGSAAAAKQINTPHLRIGFACANSLPFNAHARRKRVAAGVLAELDFLLALSAPTAHGQPLCRCVARV
jgi:hypothetical protein